MLICYGLNIKRAYGTYSKHNKITGFCIFLKCMDEDMLKSLANLTYSSGSQSPFVMITVPALLDNSQAYLQGIEL